MEHLETLNRMQDTGIGMTEVKDLTTMDLDEAEVCSLDGIGDAAPVSPKLEPVTLALESQNEVSSMEMDTTGPLTELISESGQQELVESLPGEEAHDSSTIEDSNSKQLSSSEEGILLEDAPEVENENQGPYYWRYDKISNNPPCLAVTDETEYQNCILKGCKWAPDGSCLLTSSDDCCLRLFNLPDELQSVVNWEGNDGKEQDNSWKSVLKIREGGQVYDYCFYPLMSSLNPVSSCFVATAADNPIHLWDAFDGSLRATYLPYNQSEVIVAAHSVTFDSAGEKIYCGFDKTLRIFDITRPGRQCVVRKLKQSVLPDLNLTGIVSCIAMSPNLKDVYALGTFRNKLGLYLDDGTVICVLEGHQGGLTHLKFSHDGTKLISGGRKDSRLICWDMRNLSGEYQIFDRVVNTNQRIYFDITSNDRYLLSGGTDGNVKVWDLHSADPVPASTWEFPASSDCVNGISLNPCIPLMATASGQRHFDDIAPDDDEENTFVEPSSKKYEENKVRIFNLGFCK